MRLRIALFAACAAPIALCPAQTTPLTRADAIRAALERGARIAVARADTAVAGAQLVAARAVPNPSLSTSYSKSVPRYHFSFDIPIDFPWLRQLRIRSAQLGSNAADLRHQFARVVVSLDADTTYTHAIAARERVALSRRNALDADSLLHMVQRSRDAGNASDLDVEVARLAAGDMANLAAADSLTLVSSLLDLQAVIGISSEQLTIAATDSLGVPPNASTPGRTLSETAASVSVESATLSTRLQRRSIWSLPSISFGFETSDPDQPGLLPTFGVGIGLPLFDRNRGAIAQAEAEHVRALAELKLAEIEARNEIAHATREREIAMGRVARDRQLITSANRVAGLALTAYREGASTLANVLEAQRAAREVLGQYVDHLAAAWIATAELRALATQPSIQP
jgi:cobalt-zinc-cadmium efflux system outer membrane protein